MAVIVIADNVTDSNIFIEDLGITIETSTNITLTDIFSITEICTSNDLKTYVTAEDILISNGIGWLTTESALNHITLETEYEDDINSDYDPYDYYPYPQDSTAEITQYLAKITVDNTKVYGSTSLENFPVHVNITKSFLRHTSYGGHVYNVNGYDIIFKDLLGVQLDHEIEHYDPETGNFIGWVRVPTLFNNQDTIFYAYYGSDTTDSQENVSGVWDSNYKAVWHLSESGDGTENEYKDSSGNGNHGTGGQSTTPFAAQRQNIINGIDSAQSEGTGWDAVVKAGQSVDGVIRTSDTRCTITLDAQATYDITADETITATIPASALVTSGSPIVAIPTFKVKQTYSVTLNSNFSVCYGTDSVWWTSDNNLSSGLWNNYVYRSGIDFDTSSIPDNAVITKVSLYIHINDDYSNSNCNVSKMSSPSYIYYLASNGSGFFADIAGSEYLSNSPDFEGIGDHTVELNSTARSDLQSQLSSNWFSVGWNQVDETTNNNGRDAEQYSQDEGPDLIVEYYLADVDLSGTLSDGALETEIVSGGQTLIITLTNDTWVSTVGQDNSITTALINGIDSAQSEINGWDAEVKAHMDYNDVERTSDTVVTITLGAESSYSITANEVITVTIPSTALSSGVALEANQKFPIIATGVTSAIINGTVKGAWEDDIVSGGDTIIIDLIGDTWVGNVSTAVPTQTEGKINNAQNFDGVDDYIQIDNISDDMNVAEGTMTAWITLGTTGSNVQLFELYTNATNICYIWYDNSTSEVESGRIAGGTDKYVRTSSITEGGSTFHKITLTWSEANDEVKVYLDGDQIGTTQTSIGTYSGSINSSCNIGANYAELMPWKGNVDEVRFSNIARSSDWIKTEYAGQYSPSTFLDIIEVTDTTGDVGGNIIQVVDVNGGININNETPVAIQFESETYKDNEIFEHTALNNTRITVLESGIYRIGYSINWFENDTADAHIRARARKNGDTYLPGTTSYKAGDDDNREEATNNLEFLVKLDIYDYIEIMCDGIGNTSTYAYTESNASWLYIEKL